MNTSIVTLYTKDYEIYFNGLSKSFPEINGVEVEEFDYINKLDLLISGCRSGIHTTWVDADTEIHGIIDSFIAPDGHIYVGRSYDTYFISVSPCEKSINTLDQWREAMQAQRFDADALRPFRHLVTPVDTGALLCHHMANIKEGRVNSPKRNGLHTVPPDLAISRHATCRECPKYRAESDKCGTCGCSSTMTEASKSPWRKCPENRWPITSTDKITH
jgi:hypothetical protein